MQWHKLLTVAFMALLLTACGGSLEGEGDSGGGTDPETPITDPENPTTDPSAGVTVDLSSRLLDCPSGWNQDVSLCTDTTQVSAVKPGVVAVALSQDGKPFVSQIITGSTSKGLLQPDSVLTNSDGIAYFTLVANGDEGAGRITLTSDAADQESSKVLNFEIGASNVEIDIDNDTAGVSLAQNATALITVTLTTEDGAYTSPVKVTFSSACATAGTAKLDESVTAINGVAQATYQPLGCSGTDVITASAELNKLSASTTITVASSPAQSIRYLGATPQWIALKGTGGVDRQETSTLTFKVVDKNGLASSQQNIEFILDSGPSGAVIDPVLAKTNSEGEVSTVITAGQVSGVLRVKAQVIGSNPLITSVSDVLTISTGLPDQNSFSMSLSDHSPESLHINGVKVEAVVHLADRFDNAVPDGTAVYFTTEGGAIRDAQTGTIGSCLTVASVCNLEWISQNPKPDGNKLSDFNSIGQCGYFPFAAGGTKIGPCINKTGPTAADFGGMGRPYGGRVTINAFAVGEESFIDNDADGWFTNGDDFIVAEDDLKEVFYDHNEDGYYKEEANAVNVNDNREEFHDFAPVNGVFDAGNGIYNGLLCSEESELVGECSRDLINVRAEQQLIMASRDQYIRVQHLESDVNSVDLTSADSVDLDVYFADIYNNKPPTGTTITVSTENGQISGPTTFLVGSSSSFGPHYINITVAREDSPNEKTVGNLYIELKTLDGGTLTYRMSVYDNPAP